MADLRAMAVQPFDYEAWVGAASEHLRIDPDQGRAVIDDAVRLFAEAEQIGAAIARELFEADCLADDDCADLAHAVIVDAVANHAGWGELSGHLAVFAHRAAEHRYRQTVQLFRSQPASRAIH